MPQSLQSISRESGPLMTGAVVSTTVMVWTWARLFPAQSIVLQVRVRVCPCAQSPATDPSLKVTSTSPSQLSVAIIGRAKKLLTSFDARPGDHLMVACDLRGAYRPAAPDEPDSHNWDASSDAPGERLRGDLELLPLIAERGLCRAAKDISMASFVGTTLMLLECSGVGGHLELDALPRPADVPLERWLSTFPSYGFVLAVPDAHREAVTRLFRQRDLAIASVGQVHPGHRLSLSLEEEAGLFWDLNRTPFIGARALSPTVNPNPGAHHARSAF